MLNDEVANRLAKTVTDSLKNLKDSDPKATWSLIFSELFRTLRNEGVIEVDSLESIEVLSPTLLTSTGPATGTIMAPSTVRLKGKIK